MKFNLSSFCHDFANDISTDVILLVTYLLMSFYKWLFSWRHFANDITILNVILAVAFQLATFFN